MFAMGKAHGVLDAVSHFHGRLRDQEIAKTCTFLAVFNSSG